MLSLGLIVVMVMSFPPFWLGGKMYRKPSYVPSYRQPLRGGPTRNGVSGRQVAVRIEDELQLTGVGRIGLCLHAVPVRRQAVRVALRRD
jgi:hypothetical protein